MLGQQWTEGKRREALGRGPHLSTMAHVTFFQEYFALMVEKGQWVVLPQSVATELLGLRLSPPVVQEDRDRKPWWLGYFSYSNLKPKKLPIAALSVMQYGQALDRLIREVVIAEPALGPVHSLKADVSDGF